MSKIKQKESKYSAEVCFPAEGIAGTLSCILLQGHWLRLLRSHDNQQQLLQQVRNTSFFLPSSCSFTATLPVISERNAVDQSRPSYERKGRGLGRRGSDCRRLHQRLLSKQLPEVGHMLFAVLSCTQKQTHRRSWECGGWKGCRGCGGCVLTWVEGGTSSQPLVPLLEATEDSEEQHAVARLQRRIQELPGRHAILSP